MWLLGTLALLQGVGGPVQAQVGFGAVGGVYIDAQGMLRETKVLAPDELRRRLSATSDAITAEQDVAAPSRLRKVSLRRLQQLVAEHHQTGQPLPPAVRCLAGLTGVQLILFYPDESDVVLAGPAEGWRQLASGDLIGTATGRPVLQFDDLIVALRFAFATPETGDVIGCSIEPTAAGVQAHARYVGQLGNMDASRVDEVVRGMEDAVGAQEIQVFGVEPSSRFAWQLVAADYRLKRLALAHDPSPVAKLPSYLDLAEKSAQSGPQRQHRWWFVGHYDAIRVTADQRACELEGVGLRVDTAPVASASRPGKDEPRPTRAAKQFAELATKYLPELIRQVPAFGELQNLVALSVAGALIRKHADASAADAESTAAETPIRWRPEHFLDPDRCPVATFPVPRRTPSLANVRWTRNQKWLFSVSGGVEVDPAKLTDSRSLRPAPGPDLEDSRRRATPPADSARWWWD